MSFMFVGTMMMGGQIAGSVIGANAAGSAADKQAAASQYATNMQKQMFDQQRADMQPWRGAGLSALYGPGGLFTRKAGAGTSGNAGGQLQTDWTKNRLAALQAERAHEYEAIYNEDDQGKTDRERQALMANRSDAVLQKEAAGQWNTMGAKETEGQIDPSLYQVDPELTRSFGMSDFQQDPGYQFRMDQGQKAIERSAAARGGLQSGGTLKAIADYGQNFASNEYGNAYNRFNNDRTQRYNRLSSLAGMGQTADTQVGQAGQNYVNSVGNISMSNANAQGAAGMAQANAWGQGLSGIGKTWMDATMMNKMFPGKGP